MTSAVLKWIANGVIGLVVVSTIWMAQAVQSDPREAVSLMVARTAAASPDTAASAPVAH